MRSAKFRRDRRQGARALFALDLPDRHFQPLALGGDNIGIGNVLLAKTGFQRLPC